MVTARDMRWFQLCLRHSLSLRAHIRRKPHWEKGQHPNIDALEDPICICFTMSRDGFFIVPRLGHRVAFGEFPREDPFVDRCWFMNMQEQRKKNCLNDVFS